MDTCRRSGGLDLGEEVGLAVVRKTPLDEHSSDRELVQVRCAKVVVDPATKPGTLPLLPPMVAASKSV
jgi:hypothetical protein